MIRAPFEGASRPSIHFPENPLFRLFERLLHPYPEPEPPFPPAGFFAFVWACTEGLRVYVLLLAVLSALVSGFDASLFWMLGHVVDWAAKTPAGEFLREHGAGLALFAGLLVTSVGLVAAEALVNRQILSTNFPLRLRWNFHRLMLGQSMAFHADEFAGRTTTKVMQTGFAVREVIVTGVEILVGMGVYFVTFLTLAGTFDARMMLPFVAWMGLYGVSCFYFVPRLARVGRAYADAKAVVTGRIADSYSNIATVKLFSHTRRESAFLRQALSGMGEVGYEQCRLITSFEIANYALVVLLTFGAVGQSLWLWSHAAIGPGAIAAVTAMSLRVAGLSHWVMWSLAGLFENVGIVQDGIATLTKRREVVDAPDAVPLAVRRGEVKFQRVSFAYGGKSPVLDNFDLTVRPGEKIGLVGPSGAGKSTVLNLLLRFHDVAAGRILVDGEDIARVTQESLRAGVGMVTQDTSLLHRSVRDNIAYGRPEATDGEIVAAAKRAQAHDFIVKLADPKGRRGYEAQVGERGVKLSGGQRQRIAIARVMLKDAPILLLDEATSALDSEVEAAIQASLARLMEGKTVIAVAHRLSTIAALDRLIVMDEGRVVEEGDHSSLLAQGGLYARLWARQSGGYLGEEVVEVEEVAAA
ncbi:MAG TPA: ABC transporter ATP-binding protein [Ramlibacter sp.]|uniref:ABC transporter ATP-binding protein n=1 Tax=Ramlibacter sp. TaxID=1917967 RepID=UPI002BEB8CF9|nr:ABC transporter ATP-binding protein [Ramlibacter sp.]HVZ42780.1 ABC transporter ATP-binding protein [Ramlibacter sp.]